MREKFELNGREYIWANGMWLGADYVSIPKTTEQELNLRYGHLLQPEKPVRSSGKKSNKQDGRIQANLEPAILAFIQQQYKKSENWVTRDEIAAFLLEDEKIRPFLEAQYKQTAQKMSFEQYAGNQVDWLSARFSQEMSGLQHLLEQQEDEDGKKIYRPV